MSRHPSLTRHSLVDMMPPIFYGDIFKFWLYFLSLSVSTCDAFELNKHLCSLSIRVEFSGFGKQISDKQTDEYADCPRVITSVDPNLIRRISVSSGGNLGPDVVDTPDAAAAGMFIGV